MIERDPQHIVNQEGQPIEVAFSVTSGRVTHYADVVEHLVNTEIAKCREKGFQPSVEQIAFLRKEITRYAIIRRDVETAAKLTIRKSRTLNETDDCLSPRS